MTEVNGINIEITECAATARTAVSAEHQRLIQIEYVHSVGGKWMKCFNCETRCVTQYNEDSTGKIISVNKICPVCKWESYRTKLPEPLS